MATTKFVCSVVPDGAPNNAYRTYPLTSPNFSDHPHTKSSPAPESPINCLYDLFKYQAGLHGGNNCLGWRPLLPEGFVAPAPGGPPDLSRPFQWWSYADTRELVEKVGKGLAAKFGLKKGDRVGMYARNCPWWCVTSVACSSQGFTVVPIYDTLGPNIVEYVSNHAELKVIVVSPENAVKLASALPKCNTLVGVVAIELDGSLATSAKTTSKINSVISPASSSLVAIPMQDLVACADDVTDAIPGSEWEDLAVLMYTSGTTGDPKGVMLPNKCIMASISSAYEFFGNNGQAFDHTDSILSYLPLSHIFEQQVEALYLGCGGQIGYWSGDIKLLLDDLIALKPTVFAGVPRVYARFQERIANNVESASIIQRTLFGWAYNRQLRAEENPLGESRVERSALWDALVFKKVRGRLLPNCRMAITGSAPMSSETNDYLKVCLNCPVVQGYGLTETVGGMVCSAPGQSVSGHCGGPLPGTLVKLVDVPDMNYLTTDSPNPRGEVCVKGTLVTTGYFKNEKATTEVFDDEGYFHTGDIGMWTDDGALMIIDRRKNLFKLSQGEYVSPETLEQEYAKCKLVGQIWVYGNSLESTLLAVVVPDVVQTKEWAKKSGLETTGLAAIVAKPEFKETVLGQLREMRALAKFKRYEEIKDCYIEVTDLNDLGQGFHVDNDLLTPSFKLKRPQLSKKYKESLDALYAQMKK